mmetsp:Transcript_75355/g.179071  ORF Transcript_75355/g.179071 Transcript_75355/m.179071 type:complete len:185 (+) Transcript_75355:2-556(+)
MSVIKAQALQVIECMASGGKETVGSVKGSSSQIPHVASQISQRSGGMHVLSGSGGITKYSSNISATSAGRLSGGVDAQMHQKSLPTVGEGNRLMMVLEDKDKDSSAARESQVTNQSGRVSAQSSMAHISSMTAQASVAQPQAVDEEEAADKEVEVIRLTIPSDEAEESKQAEENKEKEVMVFDY